MLIQQFPDRDLFQQLAADYNVIPVCAEVLADTETPVSLLSKFLESGGPCFLFESVEGGERWGRYSFLGVSARSHIRVYRDTVEVEELGRRKETAHRGDPLEVLRELMHRYRAAQIKGLPRFWGGLVGYLTYEMVSFFEKIPNRYPTQKPLAHFIIPDALLIFDNIRHSLLIVVICFLDTTMPAEAAYPSACARIRSLLEVMETPLRDKNKSVPPPACRLHAPLQPSEYRGRVQKAKEHIRAGDIIQTVISQPFVCKAPPDLWTLYRAQRYINPSPYLYFLRLDHLSLIGSSPETMVRLENRVATLRPIAGTRPRGKTEQADRALADELLQDEKERAKHLMLVDLGRNDLGRVATTGTVQVTDLMVVERYSHVMHLVSNITCDLRPECDPWDLLKATFPAGTLSGAPKIRAMEIIAQLETNPRGPYGGAVGYISFSGNMDLAITIRTACVEEDLLTVRAGAGIVADSDPETEHRETVNKAMAIQKALMLVQDHPGQEGIPEAMIVMIDNYDSFTYNLVQYLEQLGSPVRVVRNDATSVAEMAGWNPTGIVISPGPGRPESAGVSLAAVRHFSGQIPILGVCLGHQSIAMAFGCDVIPAQRLMHGKTSTVSADGRGVYRGIRSPFQAMRYHSLAVAKESLPPCLQVCAEAEDGEIMGIRHREHPTEGIQFHPESIMTPVGKRLLRNFLQETHGEARTV